jgi:hypothetical protein
MNSSSERTVPIVEDGIAGLWPLPRARSVGFGLERFVVFGKTGWITRCLDPVTHLRSSTSMHYTR